MGLCLYVCIAFKIGGIYKSITAYIGQDGMTTFCLIYAFSAESDVS